MNRAELTSKWNELRELYEARELRERALICITAAMLVFAVIDRLLLDPIDSRRARVNSQIEAVESELQGANQEIRILADTYSVEPNRDLLESEIRLDRQIEELDRMLDERLDSLIPPDEMVDVLERLMAEENGLELVRLESGIPEPLSPHRSHRSETAAKADAAEPPILLYRHALEIEFEGDYMHSLHYLQAIERLPWRFFWDSLDYEVRDYPKARLRLRLHTLSSEEDWIGV